MKSEASFESCASSSLSKFVISVAWGKPVLEFIFLTPQPIKINKSVRIMTIIRIGINLWIKEILFFWIVYSPDLNPFLIIVK